MLIDVPYMLPTLQFRMLHIGWGDAKTFQNPPAHGSLVAVAYMIRAFFPELSRASLQQVLLWLAPGQLLTAISCLQTMMPAALCHLQIKRICTFCSDLGISGNGILAPCTAGAGGCGPSVDTGCFRQLYLSPKNFGACCHACRGCQEESRNQEGE